MSSRGTKISINILFIAVIISIGLNVYLILQLTRIQQQASALLQTVGPALKETLANTIADLADLRESTVEIPVQVSYDLPLYVEIPFNEQIEVPIKTTVPIKQEIDTTITMIIGGVELPVDITVPVDTEVPLDMSIPVAIDRTIPVSTTIPLDLDVPVAIEIKNTSFAENIDQLQEVLKSLEKLVDRALKQIGN